MTRAQEHDEANEQIQKILRERAASLAQAESEEQAVETRGLLLFRLADETYAVDVEHVREIVNGFTVTRIPCVPSHVLGVINVRGEIVSVIDLAAVLGSSSASSPALVQDESSGIIVRFDEVTAMLVVDEIGDIIDVPTASIEPPLSSLDRAHAEMVSGSVYQDGRLIAIVNLARILQPVGESA
ncbi:MAG: chemotaxis protein CheW [Anaerosomatales bacterium]|nr:chemotaxis protein CheW [Anaerosomatales bacterium]